MIWGPSEVGDSAEKELRGSKLGPRAEPGTHSCMHAFVHQMPSPPATRQGLCWSFIATRGTWTRSCPAFRGQSSEGKRRFTHTSHAGVPNPSAGDTPGVPRGRMGTQRRERAKECQEGIVEAARRWEAGALLGCHGSGLGAVTSTGREGTSGTKLQGWG